MPADIPYTWSEDEHMLYFVLQVKGAKQKNIDVALCDVYIKVNCHPALFDADLLHEVDPEHKKTICRIGAGKVTLSLKKKDTGLWHDFRAKGSKIELRDRRQQALAARAAREQEIYKYKEELKWEMVKKAEGEQWRLDRENREQIEKWEQDEKERWEKEVFSAFDEETGKLKEPASSLNDMEDDFDLPDSAPGRTAAAPGARTTTKAELAAPALSHTTDEAIPKVCEVTDEEAAEIRATKLQTPAQVANAKPNAVAKDKDAIWTEEDFKKPNQLDDEEYEEYTPEVRENPGKMGLRFTARPRPGIPVRDRGPREPPHPKATVKSDLPPMLAGDTVEDENDPVWLKDKADNLMVAGDYQGAYNAYTEALKIGLNARAFANRAVADLYMGNCEQCIEDCNRSLAILDKRQRTPAGHMPGPTDPEDQKVRASVEVRIGVAYLWLGAYKKAEEHLEKALDTEDGLDPQERPKVKEDLARVQSSRAALLLKERADGAARRAHGSEDLVQKELGNALGLYTEAADADSESAVVYANRCFARLRADDLHGCIEDADATLNYLKQWPIARRAPKKPSRPARLDPPMLDDPTFSHPDSVKQGEVDWLMKHSGGDSKNLPPLPQEYEWIKDVSEKNDDAWIAIRKKMSKATIDAIKESTRVLQDTTYTRNPRVILDQVQYAIELNKHGEGPSAKAITQAEEYAKKLEAHFKEVEAERLQDEEQIRQEIEECDLEECLDLTRTGVARTGFSRTHPVECTQRRLFVKVLLRRARAHELLGDLEAAERDLQMALRAEPDNREAKQRLKVVTAPAITVAEDVTCAADSSSSATSLAVEASASDRAASGPAQSEPREASTAARGTDAASGTPADTASADVEDDEETAVDHAATTSLLASASDYMKRNDYQSALQVYNYLRKRCKVWETPLVELKVLSNSSLCLQRLRGRLPELIRACNEALSRIEELRAAGNASGVAEDTLLSMECACLSRRGSAYAQQQRTEESNRDAARVRELLGKSERSS